MVFGDRLRRCVRLTFGITAEEQAKSGLQSVDLIIRPSTTYEAETQMLTNLATVAAAASDSVDHNSIVFFRALTGK